MPDQSRPMPLFPTRPAIGVLPLIPPPPGTRLVLPARTGFLPLSYDDYAQAARRIGCEVRMVRAMAAKESHGTGFDSSNRPTLLFEPKLFLLLSGKKAEFRLKYPDLTVLRVTADGITPNYGSFNLQWQHLQRAYYLNSKAALSACSWGKFQLIARYASESGFGSPEQFVRAMCASEQAQLDAFVAKITRKELQQGMRDKDFDCIANVYNGARGKNTTYAKQLRVCYDLSQN